jgi:hypothetical protein
MKITNSGSNTYGVQVAGAYAFIPAGETRDVRLSAKELEAAQKIGQLSFEADEKDAPELDEAEAGETGGAGEPEGADEADEKDALIAKLAELGITKDRRSSVASLQAALEEAPQASE